MFLSQQSKQKRNNIKIGISTVMFRFPNHTLKLKAPDKPQSAAFWHVMLDNYLCNSLCKFFVKIESNWCFSKTYSEIESTWPVKSSKEEIIWSRDSKNYLNNVSWKFLIKIESMWRREIKEQTPHLTFLYHGRTVRSSHRRCCIRKLLLKILQYPPMLESMFKIFADL